jgi:hypothetical protein
MHSPAMIIAMSHQLDLQAEAEANRLARQAKQAKGAESRSGSRIAAVLTSLRSLLADSAESPMLLPKLTDYPYRS